MKVLRRIGIQTTTPTNNITRNTLPNTTVTQHTIQTKRDGINHSLHAEHNLLDKREQQNSVAIFLPWFFYLRVKKGFCKRMQNQEIQMHEIVESLNSNQ